MKKKTNLIGQKFNRLLVIRDTGKRKNGNIVLECKCDCGDYKNVDSSSLKRGNTKSCGCLHREKRRLSR